MAGQGMTVIDGIRYSAADLARKNKREAAAEARREAEAAEVAKRIASAEVEATEEFVRGIVASALEPFAEAIAELEAKVANIAPDAPESPEVPNGADEAVKAASGGAGTGSDDVKATAPASTAKKGGKK